MRLIFGETQTRVRLRLMKIHDYIAKHGIKTPPESNVNPVAYPSELHKQGPAPSFLGMNENRSIAAALYEPAGLFVVIERTPRPYRKITDQISEDCAALV